MKYIIENDTIHTALEWFIIRKKHWKHCWVIGRGGCGETDLEAGRGNCRGNCSDSSIRYWIPLFSIVG